MDQLKFNYSQVQISLKFKSKTEMIIPNHNIDYKSQISKIFASKLKIFFFKKFSSFKFKLKIKFYEVFKVQEFIWTNLESTN